MITASDYGMNDLEVKRIVDQLGREPNHVEMGIFSAMWSEHCSYKHTRGLMKQFPTKAAWVLQGPGENAGVVSIDQDWAVVFKIESHNHPSYVAPYDGACTGVGGLLRDIQAMGARPVGVKALLRCGPLTDEKTLWMIDTIQKGAADYAAGCKVASLGTELVSNATYTCNPLVNVIVLGLARKDALMTSGAGKSGNLLLYFGKRTGTDGVNGAAFASKGMDEKTEAHPPAGDPLVGNELMLATIELIESGLLTGIQDMGAAGLTCSSFEMVAHEGKGMELDLDAVPMTAPDISAYELLLSETQERMLVAVSPENLAAVLNTLKAYTHLEAAVIGKVVDGNQAVLRRNGSVVAKLPVDLVVDGFPRYTIANGRVVSAQNVGTLTVEKNEATCVSLTNMKKASQVEVSSALPGQNGACSRMDIPEIGKSVFLYTIANGPEMIQDPYNSARNLVIKAAEALKAQGATPLALSDGLNFGNPDKPAVAYQISETIRGISDACRETNIPVVGGNVSLYNETNDQPILGQAFVGVVGIAELSVKK
ncbi:MAG: phosphoribosylformylglycinamidine synthase subunit PurL [Anaerolineaceae bacterium]